MASALFQIDPGTGTYGGAGVAQNVSSAGATINCRVVNISGINLYEWECFGTNAASVAKPTPTLIGSPAGQIAQFVIPSGAGKSYGIKLRVNGGPEVTGDIASEARSAAFVLTAGSKRLLFAGEVFEENSTHGWVERINSLFT